MNGVKKLQALLLVSIACAIHGLEPDENEEPDPTHEITIDVVAATPVDALGIDRNKNTANVQTLREEVLGDSSHQSLAHSLAAGIGSVQLSDVQNNPLQPDLHYRGFAASPLLGTPQGISIYQDGVRMNEPFGDTVNWELIPRDAVAAVDVIPGSNPVYGANTLGGALSIRTRSGFTHPGSSLRLLIGEDGHVATGGHVAGHSERWGYFASGSFFREDGWRDFSESDLTRAFASIDRRGESLVLDLSLLVASGELRGNGAVPIELLEEDRSSVFTHPDITENDLMMMSGRGQILASPDLLLQISGYIRGNETSSFNGDETPFEPCEDAVRTLLCAGDEIILDQHGQPIMVGPDELDAVNNRGELAQRSLGVNAQIDKDSQILEMKNRFIAGVEMSMADADYRSTTELATLLQNRGTDGSGVFVMQSRVGVKTDIDWMALFATDYVSLTDRLTMNLGARWSRSTIALNDEIGTALDGKHEFSRLSPSFGLTWQLTPAINLFAGFGESSRSPTPVELTCADPEDPCRLPNAFVSDPPLDQVVTRTFEMGARGSSRFGQWSVAGFDAVNSDDIIFVSSGALRGTGHFENVGETRRRGLELSLSSEALRTFGFFFRYGLVLATFEADFAVSSPNHPQAVRGEIFVSRGDFIPGISRHAATAGFSKSFGEKVEVRGSVLYNSRRWFRGDEANVTAAVPSYWLAGLDLGINLSRAGRIFVTVDNLFDRKYETFGTFGEPDEVLGDDYGDPRFLGPGAPRRITTGVEWTF